MINALGGFTPEPGLWLFGSQNQSLLEDRKSPLFLTSTLLFGGRADKTRGGLGIGRETPQRALRPDLNLSPRP